MKYKTADGKTFDTYDIKLTPALKKIFTIRVGPHLSEPDAVRVNAETGDYMPLHYAKKDGVPIKENGQYAINPAQPTQAVSREAVKASLATVLPKRAVKQLQGAPAPAGDAGAAAKADELLKKYLQQ